MPSEISGEYSVSRERAAAMRTVPSATPPSCSSDPIAADHETDAPRSLSTVGSQFDRK